MIRFAVIGTNWITQSFIDAAHATGKMQLTAVYSRHLAQAYAFGEPNKAQYFFDSLDDLGNCAQVDAVYIASPNSFHYPHTLAMLQHKKHVICEKPLASNVHEVESMIACAHENQVVLFEAFKTAYLPNFSAIQQALPRLGKLRKVFLNYCQYSSRYQRYLDGENPNTFNPAFSNGSIMDIGYYCLASAVSLFGEPDSLNASATLLDSGVDAHGHVSMNYAGHGAGEGFDVVLFHSKVSNSDIPSEIQGEDGTLVIEKISECQKVTFTPRGGQPEVISQTQQENTMYYEAEVFAKLVQYQSIDHAGINVSRSTAKILTQVRALTGVEFPADAAIPPETVVVPNTRG
ncbi:gfo/Idh/MocA family oxidoreductase [Hafnia alvei]|jgi:predicted dehydrogenase|uniref:1,5-anhydro-D-fructose reductase n=2 Tax=Hafnia alvei TaxID=569 RepID=A0A377PFJ1_HAFAL|nr:MULTISPECIES: Gfo/Idh/MocA family oxidoreductase [Hafnia]MDN6632019.1 Gfo/Idh/MocA family oxidoreductase [Enterobacterales bacterium]AWV43602.1 gfo/Idh/MocA family oxidoreductase [Hafnia alvei]KFC88441.1 putative oxidoreductase [Hafnia alvei ATCC 13337]KKI43844.1 oxidoreductase [Hafnia alvei]MDX6845931.1 Gfo/Idh/MocA family oxidoreductase [Hafnia alvei]